MSGDLVTTPNQEFDPPALEVATDKAALQSLMGGSRAVTWCSMLVESQADRELLFKARHGQTQDLSNWIDKTINVRAVIAHWASTVNSKTGELDEFPRIVLIAGDGTCWESFSVGIRDCVRDLVFTFGQGPWEPALMLRVYTIKTKQPSPLQKLEYIGRADVAKPPEGDGHGPKSKR